MEGIECNGFMFYNKFDSANLSKVTLVPPNESFVIPLMNTSTKSVNLDIPDVEFNIWTKPDCDGTEFQNGNRTWFYFGMKAPSPGVLVRLNMVDINRQGKMYSQGMTPVYRVMPGKPHWERIRDKPIYTNEEDLFTLSFKYKTPENVESVTYFAFTYPFSYTDSQKLLQNIDNKFSNTSVSHNDDDIYYTREVVCYSLQNREINLLTISSYHNITKEREVRLKNLFPKGSMKRPFKFKDKKIIFVSARVHPGETPSTFVFNGFLNLLLNREDSIAAILRRLYVFKLIPLLNPDGVALGHYRTDTRGVNLNRMYLHPSMAHHPAIYAARALIRYYHYGFEKEDDIPPIKNDAINTKISHMSLEESILSNKCKITDFITEVNSDMSLHSCKSCDNVDSSQHFFDCQSDCDSGLFLYIDLHGHASKKGIFMYGNHFRDPQRNVEVMLLPKIMSLNNHNFHFTSCNFTEKNMYTKDKRDGMSREGSGRVAVLKLTGLTKSYTLECNYNTGRIVNVLPPTVKEASGRANSIVVPPKYNPHVFEEAGRALGPSILDLTGNNPYTRIPNSEFHSLGGIKDWLSLNCPNSFVRKFSRVKKTSAKDKGTSRAVKGRPATAAVLSNKKRTSKNRPQTVPLAKKENMRNSPKTTQAGGSKPSEQRQRAKSGRIGKNVDLKSKKDLKFKNNPEKLKIKKAASATKLPSKTSLTKQKGDRAKLREICVVKSSDGKAIFAKLKPPTTQEIFDDNVVIKWETASASQLFSNKKSAIPIPTFNSAKIHSAPGPSKLESSLSQTFSKKTFYTKNKMIKRSLRRLATSAAAGDAASTKMEKGKSDWKKIKPN